MSAAGLAVGRRTWAFLLTALLVVGTFAIGGSGTSDAAARAAGLVAGKSAGAPRPTIVMVHGAFADASGFAPTIRALSRDGFTVLAPPNPLRGLASDAAYLRSFLDTIPGPVVLVGHSYGGAVITQAAQGDPDIRALVYLAAYALAEGESAGEANALGGGSTELLNHLVLRPYPGAPPGDADGYIDPARFREIFAADVPRQDAAVMAASQRPAALSALVAELSGKPAWATIRSWYLVAQNDKAIPPEAQRLMARRMGAHATRVQSSHAVMVSHPDAVTDIIRAAVRGGSR